MRGRTTFKGHNRAGLSTSGDVPDGPERLAPWVQACFRARWQELRVYRGGHLVAAIERKPEDGRRIWWAER